MLKSVVCINTLSSDAAKLLRDWSSTVGLVFRELSERELFLKKILNPFVFLFSKT
jgi:hypothetical protein